MSRFIIDGGFELSGEVTPGGNKNEALPCVAATLLTDQPVILNNLPRIRDVDVMLEVLVGMGASVEELGSPNRVRICCKNIETITPDPDLCTQARASILFAGPLLGRKGAVCLAPPGGDVIGRRRLDSHFLGMQALGASFELGEFYKLNAENGLVGADIFMDEASVTATENLVMAAALAQGETILRNAACEPHVQGLCRMIESMGAEFSGVATNTLHIHGAKNLGGCEHTIGPDYLEVGSFIGLAACTNSDILIRNAGRKDLRMILMTFEKLGIHVEPVGDDDIRIRANQDMKIRRELHGAIPRIDDAPWPAFPTDLMSIAIVTATQCDGTVLFFEKMFDGRMFFTDRLIRMGVH